MNFRIAGAIFTPGEALVVYLTVIIGFALALGLAAFLGSRLLRVLAPQSAARQLRFRTALGAGGIVALLIVAGAFVIPTIVKAASWNNKQQICAKKVGYTAPQDNNSDKATAQSQQAYRNCLGLDTRQ